MGLDALEAAERRWRIIGGGEARADERTAELMGAVKRLLRHG